MPTGCCATAKAEQANSALTSRISTDLPCECPCGSRIDVPRSNGEIEHDRVRAGELRWRWPGAPEVRVTARHHERDLCAGQFVVCSASRPAHGNCQPRGACELRRLAQHHPMIPVCS